MTLAIIVLFILILTEMICRLRFPKPSDWSNPQVRHKIDKNIGYINLPNQSCFSMDASVNINSLGYRGEETCKNREKINLRILALGNSLTFGVGVDDEGTYPGQLEKMLRNQISGNTIEVINSGVIGFSLRQFIPFFEQELPKLRPDIVLLGMHWRDMHHHPRFGQLDGKVDTETWMAVKRQFEKSQSKKVNSKSIVLEVKDVLRNVRSIYVLAQFMRKVKDAIRPRNFTLWQKAFLNGDFHKQIIAREKYSREKLKYISELCKRMNAELVIFLFPDYKQLSKNYPKSIWPSILINICREAEIPYLDLFPTLRNTYSIYGKNLFVPYDVTHYSIEGNKAIAQALYDFLERTLTRSLAEKSKRRSPRRAGSTPTIRSPRRDAFG